MLNEVLKPLPIPDAHLRPQTLPRHPEAGDPAQAEMLARLRKARGGRAGMGSEGGGMLP